MTYQQFLEKIIIQYEFGDAIFLDKILPLFMEEFNLAKNKARLALAVAFKRILDKKTVPELRRYEKGIYYRTCNSIFGGEIGIRKNKVIIGKYIDAGNGYETGAGIFHRLGLTTLMPNMRYVATNKVDRTKYDQKLGITLCAPKTQVTEDNVNYLRILDILHDLNNFPYDVENPFKVIKEHISAYKLSYETLLAYASEFYNKETVLNLGLVARS